MPESSSVSYLYNDEKNRESGKQSDGENLDFPSQTETLSLRFVP